MFCKKCGNQLRDGAAFCPMCGSSQDVEQNNIQPKNTVQNGFVQEAPYQQQVVQPQQVVQQSPVYPNSYQDFSTPKSTFSAKSSHPILAVLLSILTVVVISSALLLTVMKTFLVKDNIKKVVQTTDLSTITVKGDSGLNESFPEAFSKKINSMNKSLYINSSFSVSPEEVSELLKQDFVKDYMSEKICAYVNDVLNDTGEGKITKEEVENLVYNNEEIIFEIVSGKLTDKALRKYVEEFDNKNVFRDSSLAVIIGANTDIIDAVRLLLSTWLLIVLWVVALVLSILLIIIEKRKIKGFKYLGLNILISAIITLGVFALSGILASIIGDIILGEAFWGKLFTNLRNIGFIYSGIAAGVGLVFFVLYLIVTAVQKKKATN